MVDTTFFCRKIIPSVDKLELLFYIKNTTRILSTFPIQSPAQSPSRAFCLAVLAHPFFPVRAAGASDGFDSRPPELTPRVKSLGTSVQSGKTFDGGTDRRGDERQMGASPIHPFLYFPC